MGWNITGSKELEEAIFNLKLKLAQKIGVRQGMTVVEVGCGRGGFTVSLAKVVGESGKVLSVDVSDKYLAEFMENLNKWHVKHLVTFIQADAADLKGVIPNEFADMTVGYRFLEELKNPKDMVKIVKEFARIVKKKGKVCLIELSTEAKNRAEETYIRLHKESGDSLFEPHEITKAMKAAKLANIRMETFETDIWFSPDLAKQDLGFAQVWFDSDVEKRLGALIDEYGMKYPTLLIFSGGK